MHRRDRIGVALNISLLRDGVHHGKPDRSLRDVRQSQKKSQTPILPPKCGKTAGGGAFSICGASIGLTSIGTAAVIL